jgi:hypothetical protein
MGMDKKAIFPIGGLVGVAIGVAVALGMFRGPSGPAVNPDPNHTHADFAVWVNGTQLDFTDDRYMSHAYEEGQEPVRDVNPMRKYLHLHDGNGHIIHRHKPGLTIGEFMTSIGQPISTTCMTLDQHQFSLLDAGWKDSYAITPELCNNGKFTWKMYVNGTEKTLDPSYVFTDIDKILFVYGAGDMNQQLVEEMSDDACLYSRTCPERGDPPTENCIADPTVPCVVQ